MRLVLAEIRARYVLRDRPLPASIETALRDDERPGARAILEAIERRRFERRSEGQRLRHMLQFETALWERGIVHIAGIDEAGMSPLAGPVAAGAVILAPKSRIAYVDDSKKLDPKSRERLAVEIKAACVAWCVAFVEPKEIDAINTYHAGVLAMRRAVEGLSTTPEHLLIDARRLRLAIPEEKIVKGDERSLTIAAASILAKTARDARMVEYDQMYPGYGFARHKGYPVREHYRALAELGPCAIHRWSFGPVRQAGDGTLQSKDHRSANHQGTDLESGNHQSEIFGENPMSAPNRSPSESNP